MATKEFLATQPKKRTVAGAVIFDEEGKVLIVKPNYKDYWMIPGGMSEKYETPKETCLREVEEEIGIQTNAKRLLCVDYEKNIDKEDEAFAFFFSFPKMSEEEKGNIVLQDEELSDYKFVSREEAVELTGGKAKRGLPYCFKAIDENTFYYLENSELAIEQ